MIVSGGLGLQSFGYGSIRHGAPRHGEREFEEAKRARYCVVAQWREATRRPAMSPVAAAAAVGILFYDTRR
jgi:hypothetical protein